LARKILLADDSVTAQNMGRKILADAGYEVVTVNNGSAALKRIAEHKPDLVVLDVYMPGYSGLEVCQRLKDAPDTARIPVLLTVGKLEPFKADDARRVNADAFIVKPFEASELMGALAQLEDRIVPEAGGSRFSPAVSGIERFVTEAAPNRRSRAGEQADTGWKSRIRFPSAKPKDEEAEPEPDYVTPPSFRDLRGGPVTPPTQPVAARASVRESLTPREPGLVPDIPRDITPDELDALSALVAKLDGQIPQAEEIAPLGGKIGPSGTPAPEAKADAPAADAAASETEQLSRAEDSVPAPVEAEAAPTQVGAAAEAPVGPIPTKCEPEVPAPVDRDDEPLFAQAPMAAPEVAAEQNQDRVESAAEAKEPAEPPHVEAQAKTEDLVQAEALANEDEPKPEEILQQAAVAAPSEEAITSWEQAPTEEELAEALRLLTPKHEAVPESAAMTAAPEEAAPVLAATATAEGTAQSAGTRWVAEAVSLSPAEAALSLEGEMFRTLATPSGTTPAVVEEMVPAPVPEVISPTVVAEEAAPAGTTETPDPLIAAGAAEEEKKADPEDSGAKQVAEEQEEPAGATFARHSAGADAASAEEGSVPTREERPVELEAQLPAALKSQASSEAAAGGEESIGKEGKTGKAGKSGWHQIRTTPASAAAPMDVVEAKQAEPQAEAAPKAMAAAAAADGVATSVSAEDASAIASIVDSVLADLRPKIVEEIAKKLGKK
jgi:CheY-like chemotaxis protein